MKILIADPDINIRLMFRKILLKEHKLLEAEDGPKTLFLARTENPELVFIDLNLPKGGKITAKFIQNISKAKIVYLSDDPKKIEGLRADGELYLQKPLSFWQIEKFLREY